MAKKIGIIGDGNVGSALAKGLMRAGHEVRAVGKDKDKVRDTAAWGDVVILAVPFPAVGDAVATAGGGLGFFIWNSYIGGSYPLIVVGMISIGIAGYISSAIIRRAGIMVTPWLRLR